MFDTVHTPTFSPATVPLAVVKSNHRRDRKCFTASNAKTILNLEFRNRAGRFGTPIVQTAVRNISCCPASESATFQRSMWIAWCSRFQRDHTQIRADYLIDELAFPRTAKYDERWIRENALGENALCQAESLARHLPFSAGMRVLELGCGKATSSIFLAREFGVQMWATDRAPPPPRTSVGPSLSRARPAYFQCG